MSKSGTKKHRDELNFTKRFMTMIGHPLFWFLTIAGNLMIVFGGAVLYLLEFPTNKQLQFIDCLLWSTSIVTTVGYVTFLPQTFLGKIIVMGLMLLGTFFLWSYMAFLVSALVSPALTSIEKEVQEVEKEISQLKIEEGKIHQKERS